MDKIGYYKASDTVYCSHCQFPYKRIVTTPAITGDDLEKRSAKIILRDKLNKDYTCRVCKSIIKE